MGNRNFWKAFAGGAGAAGALTVAALGAWRIFGVRSGSSHVLRLEKSMQVGRPVDEVYACWADFSRLQQLVPKIKNVSRVGNRTHWEVEVDGRRVQWEAELVQEIRNQALGWKSVSGPKHTGRIHFSPLGDNTMVHVIMNYAPPLGRLSRAFGPVKDELENQIEQALRDFKAALEGKGQEHAELRATGTHGSSPASRSTPGTTAGLQPPNEQGPSGTISYTTDKPGAVEYTRPPKDKY